MSESRMIRGTLLLTVATFLSKFLGMLFVIPFNAIVGGKDGVFLYSVSYTPYAIILSLSTVGIPLAVSKFVSRYNTLGDYRTGRKLFRSGLLVMTLTGFLGFLLMYYGAPYFSSITLDGARSGETYHNLVFIMKVLSFALIIVPVMSLMRGYFQGFESMGPTATSQTIEQIVRIGFGLVAAFIIMKVSGSVRNAVAAVTFGAFVGGVAGLVLLVRYWFKRKPHLDQLVEQSPDHHVPLKSMYAELIQYAIPFVAVGLANQLYLLIDQLTLNHFLNVYHQHLNLDVKAIIANLMTYDQKLVMIPVSLATALAVSVVPAITASFTEGKQKELQIGMTKALQFVLFFTVPAAVGLSMLAYMLYGLLYGFSDSITLGGYILRWYAPSAVLFAGFSVTAAILQGINCQKVTILSLAIGILLKMCFNPLFLKWWPDIGSIFATDLGYAVSILINLAFIGKMARYPYRFIIKRFLLISLFTLIMGLGIWGLFSVLGGFVPANRLQALVYSVLGIAVGGFIYMVLSFRSGLAKQVLGTRIPFLNRFI